MRIYDLIDLRYSVCLLLTLLCSLAFADDDVATKWCEGEVIVMFSSDAAARIHSTGVLAGAPGMPADNLLTATMQRMGAFEVRPLRSLADDDPNGLSRISLLRFDTTRVASVSQAIAMLSQLDEIELAEPNYIFTIQPIASVSPSLSPVPPSSPVAAGGSPADIRPRSPLPSEAVDQWWLEAIRMPELWQKPIVNSRRPVIAIVDTGVDTEHPDLKGNIAEGGYDIVNDTTIISDANGHGTHCAGIAAANGNHVYGANPDALILPIIVVGKDGTGSIYDIMLGILKAVNTGADIVSISLGGHSTSALYQRVIRTAAEKAVIVAAAGNDGYCMHTSHRDLHGMAIPRYANIPAAYPEVIGVMATQEDGRLALWSNFDCDGPLRATNEHGWGYQLKVPGKNIYSTLPGGEYGYQSGTSMATPMAAGAISRLMQCRDFESREEMIRALVMTSGDNIDMVAAYEATPETLHPGTFTERIDGIDVTFVETSDSTAQMGDGTMSVSSAVLPSRLNVATLDNPSFNSITVPDEVRGLSVTALAPHIFQDCKDLQTVSLGRNIESIGNQAFSGCDALGELRFATRFPPQCPESAFDGHHFSSVTIRNAHGYAENFKDESPWSRFSRWQDLDLTTGNRFTEMVNGTRMSFVIYDEERNMLQVGDGEMAVDSLFAGHLTIPATVRGMNVCILGDNAFNGSFITSVTLPRTLISIWENVFQSCSRLTEIELPWRVSYVGLRAFYKCPALRKVTFSASMSTIDMFAFAESPEIETIYMPCKEPPKAGDDAFLTTIETTDDGYDIYKGGKVYRQATLYVPYGSRIKYFTAPCWKNFWNIVETAFDAIDDIQLASPAVSAICDLQGRKINSQFFVRPNGKLSSERTLNSQLKKGVYVINGHKVVIK